MSSSGCHYSGRIWIDWRWPKEGPRGKAEGVSSFLPEEEKVQGSPHHSIPVLKGWLYRGLRLSLQKELLEKTREKHCKLHWERFHFNVIKNFFTVNTIICWSNLPRDVVGSSLLDVFKMQLEKVLHNLIWFPFPMKS